MKKYSRVLTVVATLALLSLPLILWFKAQALVDWWALKDYSPPPEVSKLAADTAMTPEAKHIFYVNHPILASDASTFRQKCPQSEQTIVLGCYHSNQHGIDVYAIKDPRLDGVKQVTAAHEMLHAAYDRLSPGDRNYINGLLSDYFNNQLKDPRIKETMQAYQKLEPNDVVNEMHSIFGTEIRNLPSPLEAYYKQYFVSRSAVVTFAENYEGEFSKRTNQINQYDQQLGDLKAQIDTEQQSLNSQLSKIQSDRQRLDSLRHSSQIEAYNAGVASFNVEVDRYNAGISRLKNDINYYNTLVEERNSVAQELRSLSNALDTRLTTQPAQ